VPDAARHLSTLFGEEVREADVLRLGLDGHLTLSVLFTGPSSALCGTFRRLNQTGHRADVRLANVHVRYVPFSGLIGQAILTFR
jgi:hypothetical protein